MTRLAVCARPALVAVAMMWRVERRGGAFQTAAGSIILGG